MNISKVDLLLHSDLRVHILSYLLDGKAYPASELAHVAKIKPKTATYHLSKMQEEGILSIEKHGKHSYYRIFNSEISKILESFLVISPQEKIKPLRQSSQSSEFRYARTCYNHLGGKLGVAITNSLLDKGYLIKNDLYFHITKTGQEFFKELGIDINKITQKQRIFAKACLDCSEREHHLAGSLGNALLEKFLQLNWIQRVPKSRAIKLTPNGTKKFEQMFSIDITQN
ncbi:MULTISPECIES: helix-turn-helix transcriptional regulator [Bacillus]|uniref:ArsR/SmtB family transcription factor n=1 Tax=Bacillus TaxID=1386 RepID=UPI000BAF5AF5|nr:MULTISPECIES: helix-turn-helix domain-containing protein [Bacillus]ASZ18579.1 transcriptional regulator [Bacillus cereus]MCM0004568.1 helix-turn-helix domain-containing protein [Bacillus paranthracis]MDA1955069.1 helix-turn-helix domain-containing protein [Bacillus cereus group sp. BcHK114]HDR7255221.1 helix-turn-helix transcriptional regulator [Bacillus pacificus]